MREGTLILILVSISGPAQEDDEDEEQDEELAGDIFIINFSLSLTHTRKSQYVTMCNPINIYIYIHIREKKKEIN